MYQLSMAQSGQTWTIYRRYKQFRELDSNVRRKMRICALIMRVNCLSGLEKLSKLVIDKVSFRNM